MVYPARAIQLTVRTGGGFTEVIRDRRDTREAVNLLHPSEMTVGLMAYDVFTDGKFDERRVGFDHLSLEVGDRDELRSWMTHLDSKGVEHSGINDTDLGPIVAFREPDNIQLEFFVHPSRANLKRRRYPRW
jgi:hypothetical protein